MKQRIASAAIVALLSGLPAESALRSSLSLRVLRDARPESGVSVTLDSSSGQEERTTDADGLARFVALPPGVYTLSVGAIRERVFLAGESLILQVDLDVPFFPRGRFGRFDLSREMLTRLPSAGTTSSVLETLDPYAVTNRIDVAGVEGGTDALWSVRGSSWSQNQVRLDALDITEPEGGAPLLYPDVASFEELTIVTSEKSAEADGPGAELHLVTRVGRAEASPLEGGLRFRWSGSALQSNNLDKKLVEMGVEPREMHRSSAARLELGGRRFYAAANGFDLSTGLPHFEAEERTSLFGLTGKLIGARGSLLAMAQKVGRPTFGARPGLATTATVDATETFQIAQASFRTEPLDLRLGFARGNLTSRYQGNGTPRRDLATGEASGAPPEVVDRERTRWSAVGSGDWPLARHLLRAGFELSRATERESERVPGRLERLTVDGVAHAVSIFPSDVNRRAVSDRVAVHAQDDFFFDALGRSWRLSPGLRLDFSHAGPIHWTSVSGALRGGVQVAPSTEAHFSLGRYPHLLTTRPLAVDEGLSWVRRRWTDENEDGAVDPGEIGPVLRRGGGDVTSIASDLPRPHTDELTIGVEKRWSRGFLRFSGYQRWERRLLQTVNVGIEEESYREFLFRDVGVDGVLGSPDDRDLPVYDQRAQFGEDAFLVTQPEGLSSSSQGVDLLLGFDHGRFSWRLSGRAYRDVGSGDLGNDALTNDTGRLGDLFDDPNTGTNAEGRLFFDRAFTGKLALTATGPSEIRLGAAVRYWDGQPFARHLFFPDLGQGFTIVQAFPRGRLRYAFNMTVDVRVERDLDLGRFRVGLALDAFNLFNQTLQTGENVRSGMQFREPTFVQPARTIVLEGRLLF